MGGGQEGLICILEGTWPIPRQNALAGWLGQPLKMGKPCQQRSAEEAAGGLEGNPCVWGGSSSRVGLGSSYQSLSLRRNLACGATGSKEDSEYISTTRDSGGERLTCSKPFRRAALCLTLPIPCNRRSSEQPGGLVDKRPRGLVVPAGNRAGSSSTEERDTENSSQHIVPFSKGT